MDSQSIIADHSWITYPTFPVWNRMKKQPVSNPRGKKHWNEDKQWNSDSCSSGVAQDQLIMTLLVWPVQTFALLPASLPVGMLFSSCYSCCVWYPPVAEKSHCCVTLPVLLNWWLLTRNECRRKPNRVFEHWTSAVSRSLLLLHSSSPHPPLPFLTFLSLCLFTGVCLHVVRVPAVLLLVYLTVCLCLSGALVLERLVEATAKCILVHQESTRLLAARAAPSLLVLVFYGLGCALPGVWIILSSPQRVQLLWCDSFFIILIPTCAQARNTRGHSTCHLVLQTKQ